MTDASASSRGQARAEHDSPRRRARQAADEAAAAQARQQSALLHEADARRAAAEATAVLRTVAPLPGTPLLQPSPLSGPPPAPRGGPLPAVARQVRAGGATAAIPTTSTAAAGPTPGRPAPRPGPPHRGAPRPQLPWHLRRQFLLPVAAVCLLGSLSGLVLLGLTYAHVRAAGGGLSDIVLAAADAAGSRSPDTTAQPGTTARTGTAAAGTGRAPSTDRTTAPAASASPAPGAPAAPAPTAAAAGAASPDGGGTTAASAPTGGASRAPTGSPTTGAARPAPATTAPGTTAPGTTAPGAGAGAAPAARQAVHGDVTYEGFGSAASTSVAYTVDGAYDGSDDLGSRFSLPQEGSASWGGWYVAVTATDGGQAGCRIRDAGGAVLVQATAAVPGDTAECAWGDQSGAADDAPDPDESAAAGDGVPDDAGDQGGQGADG